MPFPFVVFPPFEIAMGGATTRFAHVEGRIPFMKLERLAYIANIAAVVPAFYCAWGTYVLLHPSPAASAAAQVSAQTAPAGVSRLLIALAISACAVIFAAIVNGIIFLRRRRASGASAKLIIHSADYAPIDDSPKSYDVTECLRKMIAGDALVLDVENHNFVAAGVNFVPCDPRSGIFKRLRVSYSYDGEASVTTERKEHERLVLPEDSRIASLAQESEIVKSAARSANEALKLMQETSANNEKRHRHELATLKAKIEEDAKPDIKAYLEEFTYGLTYNTAQTSLFLFCQVVARNKTTSILGIKGKICTQDGSELVCQFMDDLSAWYYEPENHREELENLSLWKKLRQSPLSEEVKQVGWVGLVVPGSFNAKKIEAFKSVTLTFIDAAEREHEHSFAPPWPGNVQHLIVSKSVRLR